MIDSDFLTILKAGGILTLFLVGIFLILLPFICTVITGMTFAEILGIVGGKWWAFMLWFLFMSGGVYGASLYKAKN